MPSFGRHLGEKLPSEASIVLKMSLPLTNLGLTQMYLNLTSFNAAVLREKDSIFLCTR